MKPNILVKPPGPKARALLERDAKASSKSLPRVYPLAIKRAYGVNIEDVDGNRFLDFNSGIAVMNLGHSHPKIVKAIKDQAELATHAAYLEFYSELPVKLSEKLFEFVPGMSRTYLANSGTEAIEAAMKLARYHTKRNYFISFYGGFHGRTYGALGLSTSRLSHRQGFGPFMPVIHAPYANPYRPLVGPEGDGSGEAALEYLERAVFKLEVAPEEVAAMFVEPVQGEGGYVIPPKNFLKGLREICTKHGILYVDDEVQAGCYRTGKFLASEHFGIKPDIVCLSKALGGGLPLGAMLCKEEYMDWGPGSHASTFGGNLISCAAGVAALEVMKEEDVGAKALRSGARIIRYLRELQGDIDQIGDVRGLGMMIGIELVKDRKSKKPNQKMRDRAVMEAFGKGLSLLPASESVIRIAPPLIMERQDIDAGLEILGEVLRNQSKA
jgi:4-aminobutyrate aminotransferase